MLADHGRTSGRLLVLIDYRDRLGVCPPGRGSPDGRRTGQAIALLFRPHRGRGPASTHGCLMRPQPGPRSPVPAAPLRLLGLLLPLSCARSVLSLRP